MSNSLVGSVWEVDSLGILATYPVWVRGVMFYPNTQADTLLLKWWDESSPAVTTTDITYTITTATDDTITSTGNFPSTYADGKIIKCYKTTGSDKNVYGLIKTAGTDDAVVVHYSPFTTEASKVGSFYCFTSYTAIKLIQPKDTNEYSMWIPFPGRTGYRFPNLALDGLGASCSAAIYLA